MPTTVKIPMDIRNPQAGANQGNTFYSVLGLSAHDFGHYEFIKSVQGNLFGIVPVPANLNSPANAKVILSMIAGATTGNAVMQVSELSVAVSQSFNPGSLNLEVAQLVAVPGSAYNRFDVTFPASGNLGITPAASDIMIFEILHNGASGSETLAVNPILVEAFLQVDVTSP